MNDAVFDLLDRVTNVTLDDYQSHQARQLAADLLHGGYAVLDSPTGAGKTLVARTVVHNLWAMPGVLDTVVVVVPQNQIKDSWCKNVVLTTQPANRGTLNNMPVVIDTRGHWETLTKATRKTLVRHLHQPKPTTKVVATTHSTLSGLAATDLPPNCKKKLLIVDEGQHLGSETNLQKVVEAWISRGGSVLLCSATLYRAKGQVEVPETVVPVYRSLAEHVREGFAPAKILFTSHPLKNAFADTIGALIDEPDKPYFGFKGNLQDHAEQIVQFWAGDYGQRRKYIQNVPSGTSVVMADHLVNAFIAAGVPKDRICNAVGITKEDMDRLTDVLNKEEARYRQGLPSEIDVIIACRRAEEALNWPVATLIGNIGFPSYIGTALQRLGRALRLKLGLGSRKALPDYMPGQRYEPFGDTAEMVFFLPDNAQTAWDALWASRRHRDLVIMMAAIMEDTSLTREYLVCLRNKARTAPNLRAKDTWDRIAATAGQTVAAFQSAYAQVLEAAHALGAQHTDQDLHLYLMNRLGLTKEAADNAMFIKAIRHLMNNPTVLTRFEARITQGILGPNVSRDIILDEMKAAFDACAGQLLVNNANLFQEAVAVRQRLSEITAHDPVVIAAKLREALPAEQLTEQQALDAIESFYDTRGLRPNTTSGLIDGYTKVTWRDLDSQARRFTPPTNLHNLVDKVIVPEDTSSRQLEFEQVHRANPATLDLFIEECLKRIARRETFSGREIASHFQGTSHPIRARVCACYARVAAALVPAIARHIKIAQLRDGYIINWAALGIDPNDPKWDDYQVRAGGTLPRAMPPQTKTTEPFKGLLKAVFEVVQDGQWWTCEQIALEITRRNPDPKWSAHPSMSFEASIAARMRDFRKPQFGGHAVECEPTSDGNIKNRRYRFPMRTMHHPPPTPPPLPEVNPDDFLAALDALDALGL